MASKALKDKIAKLKEEYSSKLNESYKAATPVEAGKLKAAAKEAFNQAKELEKQAKLEDLNTDQTKAQSELERLKALPDTTPGKAASVSAQQSKVESIQSKMKSPDLKPTVAQQPTPTPKAGSTLGVGTVLAPAKPPVTATGPTGPVPAPKPKPKPGAAVVVTPDEAHAKAVEALQAMGNMGAYSVQMALIDSDPSLKEVFQRDVYDPIMAGQAPATSAKFKADIINTNWYKSYAEPAREAKAAELGDPATWKESVASTEKLIQDNAREMGYDVTPEQVAQLAQIALAKAGGKAQAVSGLVLSEVKNQITSLGKINTSGGLAASGVANLKSTAADYGVSHLFDDAWYKEKQDAILKGITTQAAVDGLIKSTAKSAYGALAPQIDAGLTVKSIMAPYTSLYGSILELAPGSASISDPIFASKAFIQDPADPSKQVLKPLWQYQQDLKSDPRWAYTQNARADLDQVGHSVLTSLGLTY